MHYRKTIVNYGIVQPLLLALLLSAVALGLFLYIKTSLDDKTKDYQSYIKLERQADSLAQTTLPLQQELQSWKALCNASASDAMEKAYNQAAARSRTPQLIRLESRTLNKRGRLATALDEVSGPTYLMKYRGSFQDLQRMFIDFEFQLPHLTTNNFSISPVGGSPTELEIEINYTVWQP